MFKGRLSTKSNLKQAKKIFYLNPYPQPNLKQQFNVEKKKKECFQTVDLLSDYCKYTAHRNKQYNP